MFAQLPDIFRGQPLASQEQTIDNGSYPRQNILRLAAAFLKIQTSIYGNEL
jgi:hypothetical protein